MRDDLKRRSPGVGVDRLTRAVWTGYGPAVGLVAFWVSGTGQVAVTMPNKDKSTLTLDRQGFGGGLEVGWRY